MVIARDCSLTLTLPLLFSTQMAFFLASVLRLPAVVTMIVEGGIWRRPGPSFRGMEVLVGVGSVDGGRVSPGRKTVLKSIWTFLIRAGS